ncbi:MAG: zf-TFIIB domain-containing protein [Dehalococcoidia bacterium]
MKCPVCDARLREVDRRGVVIDVCPECKGVWLERGELEKLLEVAGEEEDYSQDRGRRGVRDDDDDRARRGAYEDEWRRRPESYRQQKKKSSWLSQILETVGGEGD